MSKRFSMFESLESRTLMSVTPNPLPGDRLAVAGAVLQEASDADSFAATLIGDRQALKTDQVGQNSTVGPLVAKFKSDAASWALTLKTDRLNQASAVAAVRVVVVDEEEQMLADKGTSDETTDKATLMTDRAAVQQAYITGLNQRMADRNSEYAALFSDSQTIAKALASSGLSSQAQADVSKYTGDKLTALTTITNDLNGVVTVRTQLMTDLTA